MTVRDNDKKWRRIKRNLSLMDDSFTKVGLPFGVKVKKEVSEVNRIFFGDDVEIQSDTTSSELIQYAAANEFGTRNIPERPFLRGAFDRNRFKIAKIQDVVYFRLLKGTTTVEKGIGLIGEVFTRLVKEQITDLRTPPNDPATIAKKGSSNPLVDSGQLRQSITHVETIK